MKKIFLFALAALTLGFTGCVEDEPYAGISSVMQTPGAVTPTDEVTVTANVMNISEAKLVYTVNGGAAQTVTMTGNGNAFTGTIPAQADGAKVVWYVEAGGQKTAPKEYTVSAESFDYSNLVLNEVDGVNKTVELYNKGEQTLPLTGVVLIKNDEAAAADIWWTGDGASGTIAPGGYVVIKEGGTPGFSGNGGISPKKNVKFELFDPQGGSLGAFLRSSTVAIDAGMSDVGANSFQRIPNGTGPWMMATPTNNAANPATGTAIPTE